MQSNAADAADHDSAVMIIESAHHAHVDPDDLSIQDLDIARMGVGMEKAIFHDLLDEAVDELLSDLIEVVPVFLQVLHVIDRPAADIFHD